MNPIAELRTLITPLCKTLSDHEAERVEKVLSRLENAAVLREKKLSREIRERKAAEEALLKSEGKYQFLIENTGDTVYTLDKDNVVTYISPQIRQMGFLPEDIVGKSIEEFIHPDDRERVFRSNSGAPHAGDRRILEFRIVDPAGRIIWVEVNGSFVPDKEGLPAGFHGGLRDITARKLAEEELKTSEMRFREMADLLPQIIFEIDANNRLTYANKFGYESFGFTEDDIRAGLDPFSILLPADRERARAWLEKTGSTGADVRNEYVLTRKDGSTLTALIHTAPILRNGRLLGFRGAIIDITDLKRIEAALRESEQTFRALTENIPELIFSAGTDRIITYASPRALQFGLTVREMVGKDIFSFVHPLDREGIIGKFQADLETTLRSTMVYRVLGTDGAVRWIEQKASLIRGADGRPQTIFGSLNDITERKKAEAAIELANRKLNLLNNITRHDILNTITGIYGCIDMLRAEGLQKDDEQLLTDIREQVRVIQRQITFTRDYQEVGVRMPQWQNVNRAIQRVIPNFEKAPFTISADVGDIEIYADPLFEKVIYNLIDNAARYAEKATRLAFSSSSRDHTLMIVCEDNGAGIPENQKARIFERGIGRNTGMGLFLTREILDITGISIREAGKTGARFEIIVPAGNFREARHPPGQQSPS